MDTDIQTALDRLRHAYTNLEIQPLRVTAHLLEPVIVTAGLHFDSILAFAVAEQVTAGHLTALGDAYVELPLPLQVLWRNHANVPLYASTDLVPDALNVRTHVYYHKRALEPHMTTRALRTGKGRHKEKRVAFPALSARTLTCDVIGHAHEIARLLEVVSSIGKKRNSIGAVAKWVIQPIESFSLLAASDQPRRPLPVNFLLATQGSADVFSAMHISFSPPYWHPGTRDLCLDAAV